MGERIVQQVVLYMETEAGKRALPLCRKKLQEEGILTEELQADSLSLKEYAGVLYVTDSSEMAAALKGASCVVLGFLNEENRGNSFAKVPFLIEDAEALEVSYLELVYRRQKGLPVEILTTNRCILRETVEEDVDAFYRIYAEPSITRYMEDLFADREEEKRYITAYRECMYGFYGFGFWTVVLKETGEIIGRAGLDMRAGSEIPELGFVIGVPWQRQGLAEEVCAAILQYAAEELEFRTVQAYVEPGNTASFRLLAKLGFTEAEQTADEKMIAQKRLTFNLGSE